MQRLQPDLIVSINHITGLVEFCAQLDARLVIWEVDPWGSALVACEADTSRTRIRTYRPANADTYRKAGFKQVVYLALAAGPEVRASLELSEAKHKR